MYPSDVPHRSAAMPASARRMGRTRGRGPIPRSLREPRSSAAATATSHEARGHARPSHRSDVPVAVTRPAVVIRVIVTTVVLGDPVVGWRRRLRDGRRRLSAGGGVGFGVAFGAGWASPRAGRRVRPRCDDDEPLPCPAGWLETWLPAGETANQAAPNAVRPWPVDFTGLRVLDEQVERVAVVGDLPGAARAGDRSELGGGQSGAGGRLAGGQQRRPRGRARARARALGAESALNRYRVRPVELTRIDPRLLFATRTVAVLAWPWSSRGLSTSPAVRGGGGAAAAAGRDGQGDERYHRRAGEEGDGSAASHVAPSVGSIDTRSDRAVFESRNA